MAPKKKQLSEEEIKAKKGAAALKRKAARDKAEKLEERRNDEYKMWIAGGNYRDIAAQISKRGETISKSTVEKDINLMLDRKSVKDQEFHDKLKLKNLHRLETMILSHWNSALKDKTVGKFVAGLIKQENELFGLNAPIKVENSGVVNNVQYTVAEWKAEQQKRREQAAQTQAMFQDDE